MCFRASEAGLSEGGVEDLEAEGSFISSPCVIFIWREQKIISDEGVHELIKPGYISVATFTD